MAINEIISAFSKELQTAFLGLTDESLSLVNEIRLRKNMPVVLVFKKGNFFLTKSGKMTNHYNSSLYIVQAEEFEHIFRRLSDYSMHSAIDSLKNGFISVMNGNRIGVTSSAILKDKEVTSVKDITSLNIRIAKEVKDCARPILNSIYINSFPSIIVASPPNGGKTTFLRDFARLLSSGFNNTYKKVSIIDERNEIAFKNNGNIEADVGYNTDVLTGFPKAKGIEIAVRTLSPDIIICDEITEMSEINAISDGFLSGVRFAVSVHASSKEEILKKPIIKSLVNFGEFKYILLLKDYTNDFEIIDVGAMNDKNDGLNPAEFIFGCDRI